MSYLRKKEWEIIPDNNPEVIRYCPKCNDKTYFINTEKFRVNANKGLVDVWLIYQCGKCKSTWNLTIYERISPEKISREEYDKFLANDKKLAERYGFNIGIHSKNKAELILDTVDYHVISKELTESCKEKNVLEIRICCSYPIQLRVDKLMSMQLGISRSQVKKLCQKEVIYSIADKDLYHARVENNLTIYIRNISDFSCY